HPDEDNGLFPFGSEARFLMGRLIYEKIQMSEGDVTNMMHLMDALNAANDPPFANADDLYATIDEIPFGGLPWQAAEGRYTGELPEDAPPWMSETYKIFYCDPLQVMEQQLANTDFADEIDWSAKRMWRRCCHGCICRHFQDLMSGDWAWEEADKIAKNPRTHGAVFAPIVMGSDKTTVSVVSGQNEYYPLYASLGNVQNHVRRAHRNALTVIGFLAI
ncbi:hypothetical protein BDN72DRAFT_751411, partial [Pluteus cervinus]